MKTIAAQPTYTIPQRIADGLAFIYERKPGRIMLRKVLDGVVTWWEGGSIVALSPTAAEYVVSKPDMIPWPLYWIGFDADRNVWYVTRDRKP